ncbi:MAG: hypothetical protein ACI4EQ_01410 [Lachnospiraceae bacterium]
MTAEDRKFLSRINKYAEETMADIDPQKVQVGAQLDKLRPILQEIADEQGLPLEDIFIRYMDLQSEAACLTDAKMRSEYEDELRSPDGMPFFYR